MKKKYIHPLISLTLLFAMGVSINRTACVILLFQWNQKGISETACEKIVLSCEGKCFLKKQIEQKEPINEQPTSQATLLNDRNLFQDYFFVDHSFGFDQLVKLQFMTIHSHLYTSEFTLSIDRPPTA